MKSALLKSRFRVSFNPCLMEVEATEGMRTLGSVLESLLHSFLGSKV